MAFGENHEFTAASINNLGVLYQKQGRYSEAEENLFKISLQIREKFFHAATVRLPLHILGMTQLAQNKFNLAKPLLLKAVSLTKKIHGDHPRTATALNNLAGLYSQIDEPGKAISAYKKSLKILKMFLRPDHPEIAIALNNIGLSYSETGNVSEAEKFYLKSIKINRKENQNQSLINAWANLGSLYYKKQNYEQAERYLVNAVELQKRSVKKNTPI